MKLTEFNPDTFDYNPASGRGKWQAIVNEFYISEMEIAEVQELSIPVAHAYHSAVNAIKKLKAPVKATTRNGHLFLIRNSDV